MHLAYSAITTSSNKQHPSHQNEPGDELVLRYQAYQNTCSKYAREIAAIQKYLPGWVPKFR